MFSFLKKSKPSPSTIDNRRSTILSLKGLHCSSCAVNIDLTLEDLPSVESKTNYAKSECKISFDSSKTSLDIIKSTINDLGYQISPL